MIGGLFVLLLLINNLFGMQSASQEAPRDTIINTIITECPLRQLKRQEESNNIDAITRQMTPHTSLEDDVINQVIATSKQKMMQYENQLAQFKQNLQKLSLHNIVGLGQLLAVVDSRKLSEGDIQWLSKLDQKMGGTNILDTFQTLQIKRLNTDQTENSSKEIETLLLLPIETMKH